VTVTVTVGIFNFELNGTLAEDNRDDAATSLLRAWDHPKPVLSLDLG
jgi:hypothetical protein